MGKESKFMAWFTQRFMVGVTFFHIAGIALLIWGADWGTKGSVGGKDSTFHFTATLAQVAGFIAFFYDLVKARLKREPIVIMQKKDKE